MTDAESEAGSEERHKGGCEMTGVEAAELNLHDELHDEWAKLACVVGSLRTFYFGGIKLPVDDDALVWGALQLLQDYILPRLSELQEVAESYVPRGVK